MMLESFKNLRHLIPSSFPRKRESILTFKGLIDSRLRGNDINFFLRYLTLKHPPHQMRLM